MKTLRSYMSGASCAAIPQNPHPSLNSACFVLLVLQIWRRKRRSGRRRSSGSALPSTPTAPTSPKVPPPLGRPAPLALLLPLSSGNAFSCYGVFGWVVRTQTKQASEESEQLSKARAELCVEISEKQGRIATLEIECATLKQVISPGTDHSNSSALLGASRFTFNEFFWCLGCSTNFRLSWMKRP